MHRGVAFDFFFGPTDLTDRRASTQTKSLFSALKEAKEAYRQRKAEIAEERRAQGRAREKVIRWNSSRYGGTIQDAPAQAASEDDSSHHGRRKHRKPVRRNSSSLSTVSAEEVTEDALFVRSISREDTTAVRRGHQQRLEEEQERRVHQQSHGGALSAHDRTMDMAPALFNDPSVVAVQSLLARVQSIIDEINCITFSLTTLLTELQKTPETFAAVGLSLAEIANMVTHIAPTALVFLKTAFPTVFALLSSPHFAVIAGVAGAATVIVLGGYKIVKSIMAGADVNMALAYGDLPDEAILEETALGGEILGEVIEEGRRIDAAPSRSHYEPVEELPPVAVPKPPERVRKQLMPTEDPITTSLKEESRWLKRNNNSFQKSEDKKSEDRKERAKVGRRHTSAVASSSKKEDRRGKDKDRDSRERKPERRATSARQGSSSPGVSSSRSDSSERPDVKTSKPFSSALLGKGDNKKKKKNAIMKLFDGKSK